MASISQNFVCLVDGSDLACALKSLGISHELSEVDSTHLCNTGDRTFKPSLKASTVNLSGSFDNDETTTDKIDNILSTAYENQASMVASMSLGTASAGGIAIMFDGAETNYEVSNELDQLIMASSDIRVSAGAYHGKWIYVGSADTETIDSASLDNTASTANGGLFHAHVHLESDSDATDASFVLQHSTDDSVWVDLVASTAIGGTNGAITSTVARGTTVNRYLRVQFTATGGVAYGSASFHRFL